MAVNKILYKWTQAAIGSPEDPAATNSTDEWSSIALLKAIFAKLSGTITVSTPAGGATSAKQDTGNTALASILAKIIAAPATEAKQDTANTALGTLATQATAAAILAKLIAAPSTEAKQDTGNTSLASITSLLATQAGYLDGIEALIGTTNGKDFATQTTLAAVLAKIIAAPATEAKQDAAIVQETATATVLGVAADAASATTTIKAALRGIATALGVTALDLGTGTGGSRTLRLFQDTAQWIGGAGAVTSAVQRATLASDDPAVAVLGATSGAAVTTNATGTIQQYLRGIVSLLVSGITVASHAVTNAGTFAVQATEVDGANATLGAKADAKSTASDATAISAISIWKQISFSVQAIATSVAATLAIKHVRSSTGTQTSVAGSAADGTILASNANRLGASVYNDSTAVLYLLLASATSSSTNYSVQIVGGAYFEVPANYTGVVKGLWSSATGNARVTEYS